MQIVAVLALLPMLLGILQTALLSTAYHLLGFATAEAARAGSVHHAQMEPMYSALAAGLAGLHGGAQAWEEGRLRSRLPFDCSGGSIDWLHRPVTSKTSLEIGMGEGASRTTPWSTGPRHAAPNGSHSIQEANWLRIRVRYCHELVVPFVASWLPALLRRWDEDPDHQRCYAADRVPLTAVGSSPMQTEARP